MQVARSYSLKFSEVGEGDGCIEDVVVNMEGGPYQEYFYVEIPTGGDSDLDNVRYAHAAMCANDISIEKSDFIFFDFFILFYHFISFLDIEDLFMFTLIRHQSFRCILD